jgi:acetolactate synthase-1/2/3 large subunit
MTSTGVEILFSTLFDQGVRDVFGLPGSQTVGLYEGLRRSRLRTVLAGSELAAAFMANGYFRASGRTAAVTTGPGPGFAYAVPGIAEAFLDSAAVLWIAASPAESRGQRFGSQAINQAAIARSVVKAAYRVQEVGDIAETAREALAHATRGEPGPVLIEIDEAVFDATTSDAIAPPAARKPMSVTPDAVAQALAAFSAAGRVAFYVGAGSVDASIELRALVERLQIPVVTTTSGRGILPERHPLLIVADPGLKGAAQVLNAFFERCDLVIALGWKASHNSTCGFRLRLSPERLIHVDASSAVLGANYPARLSVECDAGAFVRGLLKSCDRLSERPPQWTAAELATWRARGHASDFQADPEPVIHGGSVSTAREFFTALRRALPAESCVVTDSGLHQVLARQYFEVQTPRGLLVPTNFQSMGFGVPAAIGAKLAAPDRPVVAVVGDGSLAISGMELMTAVRERVPLTIVLFNDESLGLIRLAQLGESGQAHATELVNPDYATLADAMGVQHIPFTPNDGQSAEDIVRSALATDGVTILELRLRDSSAMRRKRVIASARSLTRRTLRRGVLAGARRWLKGN